MGLKRRGVLKGVVAVPTIAGTAAGVSANEGGMVGRVRPYDPEWPSAADWQGLKVAVGGRLAPVVSTLASCAREPDGQFCASALKDLANPLFIQDHAGGTQSAGWIDGWTSAPSVYAVAAEDVSDVVAAVRFAAWHNFRLVIKGGAHSDLGQFNCADSSMIWTKGLDTVWLHERFVPEGCEGVVSPQDAASVGAGAKFYQLYDAVVTKGGRLVQGGSCTTVGIGGRVQTGGFGSFSKYGGLVAASLLEVEIVTADGEVRIANACRHSDLFWALRGGGAGFGVTARLILATRPLREQAGFLGQRIAAASDQAFLDLIGTFCRFISEGLINPHRGEQTTFGTDNTLQLAMVFQGLSEHQVREVWTPFWDWVAARPEEYPEVEVPRLVPVPLRHWWDYDYRQNHLPQSNIEDDRPGAPAGRFRWAGNSSEVGISLNGYESVWLPETLLAEEQQSPLARTLFEASRKAEVTLHFNKGIAGATEARRKEARATAIQPSAIDAFALVIIAGGEKQAYPGVLDNEPDMEAGRREQQSIREAYRRLRKLAPESGSYSSEMSFFEKDWQGRAWGPNYAKLRTVKNTYDPEGLLTGHDQVGSKDWSPDGFTRTG